MNTTKQTEMLKVNSSETYDYYIGYDSETYKQFYNIVPANSPAPNGGYAKEWILGVKKAPDLFTERKIDFTPILNAPNGQPRYVCHFFNFLTQSEVNSYGTNNYDSLYNLAVRRAKQELRGKKFHNKQYGGGIVFTLGSLSLSDLTKRIIDYNGSLEINEDSAKAAAHC
jgi:hypothetical protein